MRILSLPARHPYTSKFHQSGEIVFVNPGTDYFNKIGGYANSEFIKKAHPPNTYDIVHIHFSFDKLGTDELETLLKYFKSISKPIVWTCHSRESLRKRNIGNGILQRMLFSYADTLITPTNGCRKWIIDTYGNSKIITVIPLGYMADPKEVVVNSSFLKLKKKENFIYLVGDMRKNKEINLSISHFLNSGELSDCKLTVITKPIPEGIALDERRREFWKTLHSSWRIHIISQPEVSNEYLTQLFCQQHVCMLPYLWGTHSGQIELAKDCGCWPVISNVGFFKEQGAEIIEFNYSNNLSEFADNLIGALIKARNADLLSPQPANREKEMNEISRAHIQIYRSLLSR
ncbi:MAG: hypothetical protein UR98_C0014G0009 [Parcubacteria group bacterium GW2011_GWA1_36_12]|uniref:Glycosyltransferase subfamily 4-like N-terminal domain-containing protein n=1 Tax=Candidatus Daviesbacteria bacterium GW2011_GWB1_41_5 TaxID=1618429 RepID=A0A0G0WP58_9BACT|nr:MAG: hypothetical protein UR98_C0014G0009 [Parcubacteria group bacterium GW2011_GWA1_36_12]KKS13872.1 MAG: hypothetical protein UU67_C0014G0006 [Candidatus Daviesbacteria bacterium GW2011_GWB1_41_5]